MIHFFTTEHHRYTVEQFVGSWMPEQTREVGIVTYEKIPVFKRLHAGVCVFTDMERLHPSELRMAKDLAQALRARKEFTVVNDPANYLSRFDLLQRLAETRVNDYRVFRVDDETAELRYPVFIRNAADHLGPLTGLIENESELRLARQTLRASQRKHWKNLIIVEYCDTSGGADEFRKYSVMNVAGVLVPRHVLVSEEWATKNPDVVTEEIAREEDAFVRDFPHSDQIRRIFEIAGVEYGRIDYGLRAGRVQVWEINTNPIIVPLREKIDARRMRTQSWSAGQIASAFRELAARRAATPEKPFLTPGFIAQRSLTALTAPLNRLIHGRRP